MIKATLKYTDCLQDGRRVFMVLTANRTPIIKTKPDFSSIYTRVVVLFKDYDHLLNVLYQLNDRCTYEVRLVKYKNVKEK